MLHSAVVVGQKLFGFLIPFEKVSVLLQYHVVVCVFVPSSRILRVGLDKFKGKSEGYLVVHITVYPYGCSGMVTVYSIPCFILRLYNLTEKNNLLIMG